MAMVPEVMALTVRVVPLVLPVNAAKRGCVALSLQLSSNKRLDHVKLVEAAVSSPVSALRSTPRMVTSIGPPVPPRHKVLGKVLPCNGLAVPLQRISPPLEPVMPCEALPKLRAV